MNEVVEDSILICCKAGLTTRKESLGILQVKLDSIKKPPRTG